VEIREVREVGGNAEGSYNYGSCLYMYKQFLTIFLTRRLDEFSLNGSGFRYGLERAEEARYG
jgi:hypothetical protein